MHEWRIAIYDLVEENKFAPARVKATGPYRAPRLDRRQLHRARRPQPDTYEPIAAHYLSLTPFRRLIRDYFRIRESYYEAIKTPRRSRSRPSTWRRRGLHNEAAELLRTRLDNKLEMDLNTARRLFTLICAVQPFASRIDERDSDLPDGALRLFDELGAFAHRRRAGPQVLSRSAHRPFRRRPLRQGRRFRPYGDGRDRRRHVRAHAAHLDELVASRFDLVVTLSADAPEAVARRGLEIGAIEHWPMPDPTLVEGNREALLSAYRTLRDTLQQQGARPRSSRCVASQGWPVVHKAAQLQYDAQSARSFRVAAFKRPHG